MNVLKLLRLFHRWPIIKIPSQPQRQRIQMQKHHHRQPEWVSIGRLIEKRSKIFVPLLFISSTSFAETTRSCCVTLDHLRLYISIQVGSRDRMTNGKQMSRVVKEKGKEKYKKNKNHFPMNFENIGIIYRVGSVASLSS